MAPTDEFYELNVGNVMDGKFPERFGRAFQQVIENMRDPNTPADAVRKITFEFIVKPSEDRSVAAILLKTNLKLASLEAIAGTMYVSKADGALKAYTRDIRQEVLWKPGAGEQGPKQ